MLHYLHPALTFCQLGLRLKTQLSSYEDSFADLTIDLRAPIKYNVEYRYAFIFEKGVNS